MRDQGQVVVAITLDGKPIYIASMHQVEQEVVEVDSSLFAGTPDYVVAGLLMAFASAYLPDELRVKALSMVMWAQAKADAQEEADSVDAPF